MNFIEGEVLFIYKPLEWTSFDLVRKIRKVASRAHDTKIKIGHAGTLDPLAEGLMILCTGKKTKEIDRYQGFDKEYIATFKLGATTPSYDLETEEDETYPTEHITEELVRETLLKFLGHSEQLAPAFSAKKVNGQRAYKKARKGIHVEIAPSKIQIKELEILDFQMPNLVVRILCSKGTYIRALARDIGEALQSGAHMIALQRTKIGEFTINESISIEDFENGVREEFAVKSESVE